jgi:hypothetical protein
MNLKLSIVLILLILTACSSANMNIDQTATSTKANIVAQSTASISNVKTGDQIGNKVQDLTEIESIYNNSNKDSVSDSNKQMDLIITANQFQITYPFELTKYTYCVGVDELSFMDYNRPEAEINDVYDVIGGVDILGTLDGMGKYNHSNLLSKKEIKGKIPTYQYLLLRDAPKGTDPTKKYTESHVYLVINDKLIYNIWFLTDYVSEDKLLEIAQTFKLINIPNESTTTAKTDESE